MTGPELELDELLDDLPSVTILSQDNGEWHVLIKVAAESRVFHFLLWGSLLVLLLYLGISSGFEYLMERHGIGMKVLGGVILLASIGMSCVPGIMIYHAFTAMPIRELVLKKDGEWFIVADYHTGEHLVRSCLAMVRGAWLMQGYTNGALMWSMVELSLTKGKKKMNDTTCAISLVRIHPSAYAVNALHNIVLEFIHEHFPYIELGYGKKN